MELGALSVLVTSLTNLSGSAAGMFTLCFQPGLTPVCKDYYQPTVVHMFFWQIVSSFRPVCIFKFELCDDVV